MVKIVYMLGWFSPTIIKVNILLQQLWELKVDWDDPLPPEICEVWLQWRSELRCSSKRHISCCHFPKEAHIVAVNYMDSSKHRNVPMLVLSISA